MKKKLFGIILILVIVALTYFYIKGKGTINEVVADPNTIVSDERLKLDSSEEMLKIRLVANDAYRHLKGWGPLHHEP